MSWLADWVQGIVYAVRGKAERERFTLQLTEAQAQNVVLTARVSDLEHQLDITRQENEALRQRVEELTQQLHTWASMALEYRPKDLPPLLPPA